MNTPVNFETSKLLKEKGFEQRTKSYTEDGKLVTVSLTIRRFIPEKIYYPAPIIAEVVMWLYEKHEIWIYVPPSKYGKLDKFMGWIIVPSNGTTRDHSTKNFNSPTEAYEAAIKYTLKNLI